MPRGPFISLDDTTQWIAETLEDQAAGSEWAFAIVHLPTGSAIGSTRYWKLLFHATEAIEIGYTWITPAHWRTAVNTESKYLLLQQAIERLGGVREGMLRCHRIPPDGYRRSSVVYSIIDEEWPR